MPWFTFDPKSFAFAFLGVLFESIPFLLLGSLVSGAIEVFVPAKWMTRVLPRRPGPAILLAGLLGILFPMCECGIVPVIRRLMKKGLPISCAVTYLLACPVVNPITALSTYAAFRGQQPGTMLSCRLILSYLVALIAGFIVQRLRPEQFLRTPVLGTLPGRARRAGFSMGALAGGGGSVLAAPFSLEATDAGSGSAAAVDALDALEDDLEPNLGRRLLIALQRGANDFLDVAVFVVVGAALASLFNTSFDQARLETLATQPGPAVAAMMALSFIVAVCSTSDAFIAATFVKFPFASRLAFLVFGPVFDLKLLFLYSAVFRRRFVAGLGIGLFVLIGLICLRLSAWKF